MLEQEVKPVLKKASITPPPWSVPIYDDLMAVENRLVEVPAGHHEMLAAAIQNLFTAGGKRLRPVTTLLITRMLAANREHAVAVSAAVEMLHTATLVHDDLIDGAMLRRGAPTLNSIWSSDIAVLVGDYLFARGAKLIASVQSVPIMEIFAETLSIILNGEITQKFTKWQVDRAEYYDRIYAKTAALFVLSTQSGALLGGAAPSQLKALIDFGHAIGMAFQIVDDILDFTGSTRRVGKPIGGDLRQGLVTLPTIYFSEAYPADPDLNHLLESRNGNPELTDRVIEKVRNSAAIQQSLAEARDYVQTGRHYLRVFPTSEYKTALLALADSVVTRDM